MEHILICGCDLATSRVIINAEVSCAASAPRSFEQSRNSYTAVSRDDRLRRFDHHLHLESVRRKIKLWLDSIEDVREGRDLFRRNDLWQCHDKIIRKLSA